MIKKVLLVATVQSHICQFHKPLVEMLHSHGVEVHVAAKDNLAEKNGLKLDFVEKVFDVPFSRSPKSPKNIKAYKQLKKIINENGYDVVHCNTPMGGIVGRLAARNARKKKGTKVFYTAHGFHFYKGSSKKSWIFYYPIEKFFANHYTDNLITITQEDYKLASSKFKCKTYYTHGVGVDDTRYYPLTDDQKKELRKQSGLDINKYQIICTGELNDNKNQICLLKAVNKLKDQITNLKVLLAGNGKNEEMLKKYIADNNLTDIVQLLGYRKDLEIFVPCSDLVVSCSKREGLPLNIVEAMLCKIPVIASYNRGHNELLNDGKRGIQFKSKDFLMLCSLVVLCALETDRKRCELAYKYSLNFRITNVTKELENIYEY